MSCRVYPVNESAVKCGDYRVFINKTEYFPDSARVSAMPFNCRWPGHQRCLNQTETINFISLETDEALEFEIVSKEAFDPEKLKIRPTGSVEKIESDGKKIRFSIPGPGYYSVEPFVRNRAFLIFADKISTLSPKDFQGDILYFGPGVHHPGLIELKSGQTLFIDAGALVYATLHASDAENVSIVGRGILDNSENKEIILFEAKQTAEKVDVGNAKRSNTIQLDFCKNVRIEGITIRDSLVYNVKPVCCENVRIKDLKLIGNWRYNSDGIDMHNCLNVKIENCFIRTFDDCICAKGFDPWLVKDPEMMKKAIDVFDGLEVRGCTLWNDWGKCLEAGVEMRSKEIKNILFEDCRIIHATHTVLDCGNYDYAAAHDITYRNITAEYGEEELAPLYQESDDMEYYNRSTGYTPYIAVVEIKDHHEYSDKTHGRGTVDRVKFENINVLCPEDRTLKMAVKGFDKEHGIRDVEFKNVRLNGKIPEKEKIHFSVNEFTENVRFH
ncbi:MAG: hypothetical protein IJV00_05720 [Clostridia bacterium]|nr:hypothetical protein [Clostridia bacterium]